MKKKYILIGTFIITLLLGLIGFTYAWFTTHILGNENAKDVIVDASEIKLIYEDVTPLLLNEAMPGDTVTKVFTVQNTSKITAEYQIKWKDLINTFKAGELRISLTCISKDENDNVSGTCASINNSILPYTETLSNDNIIKDHISIDSKIKHEYTLTLEFIETNEPQDYNQEAIFEGKINITKATPSPINNCVYDGNLTQGVEYVNGQYTYRYKQQGTSSSWENINADGWGVKLTDKDSTDAVTTPLCASINEKPIVSMSYMFSYSKASSIDLSSFDTSKVTDMRGMFWYNKATTLDLSSFDTSNVTDMGSMFVGSQATTLDLSSFDTRNVTNMSVMFGSSQATTLDLSSFDTSNVTDMSDMFYNSKVTTLDLSSFDTRSVVFMSNMFSYNQVTELDLSSFDTSNVTDMSGMFSYSQATQIIGLDEFNTSNVTNMSHMFSGSQITTIDIKDWNSPNGTIIDMSYMFYGSNASTIFFGLFDVSNVIDMSYMFAESNVTTIWVITWDMEGLENGENMFLNAYNLIGGNGTEYDPEIVDSSYARIDQLDGEPGYFTMLPWV